MAAMVDNVIQNFLKTHTEELNKDGKLRICVGGGAGFIGSHIAKKFKEQVKISQSREVFLSASEQLVLTTISYPMWGYLNEIGLLRHRCGLERE